MKVIYKKETILDQIIKLKEEQDSVDVLVLTESEIETIEDILYNSEKYDGYCYEGYVNISEIDGKMKLWFEYEVAR